MDIMKNLSKLTDSSQKTLLLSGATFYTYILPLFYAILNRTPEAILSALGPIALIPLNRLLTIDKGALLVQIVSIYYFSQPFKVV